MNLFNRSLATSAFAAIITASSSAYAQDADLLDEGSLQMGAVTVSIGSGIAMLDLPDITSFIIRTNSVANINSVFENFKFSDDFSSKTGWNINGSIDYQIRPDTTISLNAFWARIDDKASFSCHRQNAGVDACFFSALVDDPTALSFSAVTDLTSTSKREVDNWGVAIESKWDLTSGYSYVDGSSSKRTLALGADIRGIDQDLDTTIFIPAGSVTVLYNEKLDTQYTGIYASWGGDYAIPFLSNLTQRFGLETSFLLRGGIYYANTNYKAALNRPDTPGSNLNTALSLDHNEISFIGGLTLETRKKISRRMSLSLKSEYEYYSYVPDMNYRNQDIFGGGANTLGGSQTNTVIGSDDAYSIRTSLRLTIKLGPDDVLE